MRKLLILLTLLLCTSLWAADNPNDHWRISILAAEISTSGRESFAGSDRFSNDARAGVGLGIAYAPTSQWDVELTAASQTYISPYTRIFVLPYNDQAWIVPVTEFHQYRVYPLDLAATRHFLTNQPIAPYVRAGVRYVDAPGRPAQQATGVIIPGPDPEPVSEGYGFADRVSAQAGAGVRVRITPRTAFRAEVNRLLRTEKVDFDPLTRFAIGVSASF